MTDLDELEKKAKAAMLGDENCKWEFYDNPHCSRQTVTAKNGLSLTYCEDCRNFIESSLEEDELIYIAAASPDVVLGLIERIRELEKRLEWDTVCRKAADAIVFHKPGVIEDD